MLTYAIQLVAKIDALKYLLSKAAFTSRIAKWMMILSEFGIQFIKRKAIKGQTIADQSTELPIADDTPLQIDFLDAFIMYTTTRT